MATVGTVRSSPRRAAKTFAGPRFRAAAGSIDDSDAIINDVTNPPQQTGPTLSVMGPDGSNPAAGMSWKELDEKVNEYPSDRKFQAIGEGGAEFVKVRSLAHLSPDHST